MSEPVQDMDILTAQEAPPLRRGHPLIAWLVIALIVIAAVVFQHLRSVKDREAASDSEPLGLQMQGRYLVGAADLLENERHNLYSQSGGLNTGPVGQRLRFVVLAGELAGPIEARKQLQELRDRLAENHIEPTASQQEALNILQRLYADYEAKKWDAPQVSEAERALLRRELGWFGDLALAPADGPDPAAREQVLQAAHKTVLALGGALLGFGVLLFTGLIGAILLLAFYLTGRVRSALACGSPFGGIYAETFALWMLLFAGLNIAAQLVDVPGAELLVVGAASLLSLTALFWPVLRGVPWRQVRQEVGLTAGRRPVVEPALGVGCYAMSLPLLVPGLLVTLLLITLQQRWTGTGGVNDFGSPDVPSHPIVEVVAGSGWWGRMQVLLLAAVVAPVVEETMFRGVLYRHLREASNRWALFLSVLFSATVASLVFAVIHPQGLLAVPALMALAIGFSLAREWRGTLVPAMVAHGLNNALVTLLLMAILEA